MKAWQFWLLVAFIIQAPHISVEDSKGGSRLALALGVILFVLDFVFGIGV